MEEYFESFAEGQPSRKRMRIIAPEDGGDSTSNDDNNYYSTSAPAAATAHQNNYDYEATPTLDIEQCTSLPKLQRHASHLETELQQLIATKQAQIDLVHTRITHLRDLKRRSRKRCTTEGCTNFAHAKGVCARHGAVLKRCNVENCTKKAQKGGVCARHGANQSIPKCSIADCHRFAKRGGVCGFHDTKRCSVEGCTNQPVRGGMCDRHGTEAGLPNAIAARNKKCKVEGCTGNVKPGGVCVRHGAVQKRYNCSVEGCAKRVQKDKLCIRHWREKARREGDGDAESKDDLKTNLEGQSGSAATKQNKDCIIEDCTSQAQKDKLCMKHWNERERRRFHDDNDDTATSKTAVAAVVETTTKETTIVEAKKLSDSTSRVCSDLDREMSKFTPLLCLVAGHNMYKALCDRSTAKSKQQHINHKRVLRVLVRIVVQGIIS